MGEAPGSPLHAAACWNPNSRCPTEILCSSAFGGKVAMRHTGLPFGGMPRGCRSRNDQQLNPLPSRTEAPHQYSLGGHPQEPLRPHAGLEQPPASDCSMRHCRPALERQSKGTWATMTNDNVIYLSLTHPVVGTAAADILLCNAPILLHAAKTGCLEGLGGPTRRLFEAVGSKKVGIPGDRPCFGVVIVS